MVKIGLSLPTAGPDASSDAITTVAEAADRIGLDSLWSFERLLSPVGEVDMFGRKGPMPEIYHTVYSPLETLAYVAGRTSRVRLGTSVIVALLHNPVALARSMATLDQLSGGRLIAGLGQGWMPQEFDAAGVDMARQGAGFGEFIEAMRAVWGPDPVSFDGKFYSITPSKVNPKPAQPGGPPIIVGASTPASIRRTARTKLGLNPLWFGWESLESSIGAFHTAARDAGIDPAELPVVVRVNQPLSAAPAEGDATPVGSPDQVAEILPRLKKLGVTEIFWPLGSDIDQGLGLMERLVDQTR
ncbi:TIGR03619 family F420-dependent LLM class oxidoreductase [Phytoactinopolyspora mesophila]|nr:TIGR03619 family F420-dependent LLM class oxidoreductase [Phytoactinopolyspora mesophila]